jgi:hypothetical protein
MRVHLVDDAFQRKSAARQLQMQGCGAEDLRGPVESRPRRVAPFAR